MSQQADLQGRSFLGQFSLRSLMLWVTAICVLLGLALAPPLLILVIAATYMSLTGVLVIAVWEGRGWARSFAAGALLPHLCGYLAALAGGRLSAWIVLAVIALLASFVSGCGAATFHGALARHGGKLPVPRLPFVHRWWTNDWHSDESG